MFAKEAPKHEVRVFGLVNPKLSIPPGKAPDVSPNGQASHWNCNAETYYLIGEAMGVAMKKLCATTPSK